MDQVIMKEEPLLEIDETKLFEVAAEGDKILQEVNEQTRQQEELDQCLKSLNKEIRIIPSRRLKRFSYKHLIKEEDPPLSLCNICGKTLKKSALQKHLDFHASLKCVECKEQFQNVDELEAHSKTHLNHASHACDICDRPFSTITDMAMHRFSHTRNYSCPICGFTTTEKCRTSFKWHMRRHEGNFVANCDICNKGFMSRSHLDTHMEVHEAIPKYKCEFCSKKFPVKRYLYIHKQLNHKKEMFGVDEQYECMECGRGFKFEKSLERHLSTIHHIGPDRRVKCPVCSKVIANNHNLKMHMKIHTGEKTYCCDLCGKAFSQFKYWKKHQNVHKRERDAEELGLERSFRTRVFNKDDRMLSVLDENSDSVLSIFDIKNEDIDEDDPDYEES